MARKKKETGQFSAVKLIVVGLLTIAVVGAAGYGVAYLLRHNNYFRVRSVVIDPSLQFVNKRDLKNLLGKNIFDIDLKAVQRQLSFKYPQASDLKVAKRFPNRIAVIAKQRFPFAQIIMPDKAVIVDNQSIVLSLEGEEDKKLPRIISAKLISQEVVRGLPFKGEGVSVALDIAGSFQQEKSLSSYEIRKIDVENLSKIVLTLSNDLDVIVDRDKIAHRVRILGVVLAQDELDLKQVKYVDLRFKEPIIGKR